MSHSRWFTSMTTRSTWTRIPSKEAAESIWWRSSARASSSRKSSSRALAAWQAARGASPPSASISRVYQSVRDATPGCYPQIHTPNIYRDRRVACHFMSLGAICAHARPTSARAAGRRGALTLRPADPRVADVEGRLLVRVALGSEAGGIEVMRQAPALAARDGLHLDVVLPRPRRRAVGQQVEAARRGLDAIGDLVEPARDVGPVLRGEHARAADVGELALVDLGAHADGERLERRRVQGLAHVVLRDPVRPIGAVREDHQGPEAPRLRGRVQLATEALHRFDDGAVQVRRGVLRAVASQRRHAGAHVAPEGDDRVDVRAAVERVDGALLGGAYAIRDRRRRGARRG